MGVYQNSNRAGRPVSGMLGETLTIPQFDIIKGTSFDYMHCVLLGVTRLLLRLWFTPSHRSELWYIGNKTHQIDRLLTSILPPDEMKRTPRHIETTLKFWKAHELKAWLLHYSPVVLHQILHEDFYQHHLLLVESIYLLLKDVVTVDDITQSTKLLHHYCYLFSDIYGDRYMTINVHGLLHLPDVVRNLGPLWAHSCFPFESANGDILKLFHGSKSVEKQVIQHVASLQGMPTLTGCLEEGSEHQKLYRHMSSGGKPEQCNKMTNRICAHGRPCATILTDEDLRLFTKSLKVPTHSIVTLYSKIHLIEVNRIITSKAAYRGFLRDNSGIIFSKQGTTHYGRFEKLLVFEGGEQQQAYAYAIIQPFSPTNQKLCVDSITNCQLNSHIVSLQPPRTRDTYVVEVDSIVDKCVLMDLSDNLYASYFPNCLEPE